MVTTHPPKTIVKPTALGPVANTDTKLLIYGLFQKGRVLAQDEVVDLALAIRFSYLALPLAFARVLVFSASSSCRKARTSASDSVLAANLACCTGPI